MESRGNLPYSAGFLFRQLSITYRSYLKSACIPYFQEVTLSPIILGGLIMIGLRFTKDLPENFYGKSDDLFITKATESKENTPVFANY